MFPLQCIFSQMLSPHVSHEKNSLTLHYTGYFIGIVLEWFTLMTIPHITG